MTKSIFKLNEYHLPKIKNRKQPKWFDLNNQSLKDAIKKRDIAYKLWNKDRTNDKLHDRFKQLRKEVDSMLCKLQNEYWINIGISLKQSFDSSRDITFYKLLKSSLGLNIKHYKAGKCGFNNSVFDKNGEEIFDKEKIKLRWRE